MNVSEAREVIKAHNNDECICDSGSYYCSFERAVAYLDAIEGDGVNLLINALKTIAHIPDVPDFDSSPIAQVDAMCAIANKALEEFKKDVLNR